MAQEPRFDTGRTLDVLAEHAAAPGRLIAGLGEVFDEVIVLERAEPVPGQGGTGDRGHFRLALDLWLDGQPYATAICEGMERMTLASHRAAAGQGVDRFSLAGLHETTDPLDWRVHCMLDYWDPETSVDAFARHAVDWAGARIASARAQTDPLALRRMDAVKGQVPRSGPWAMSIAVLEDGPEAHASISMIVEAQP